MKKGKALDKLEIKYRQESDARTLASAEVIKSDKLRMKNAKIGAERIFSDSKEEMKGYAKILKKKI